MAIVQVPSAATGLTSASSTVATSQTTTANTSYTDLATSGPAVTLTTGTKVLVIVSHYAKTGQSNRSANMDFAISGATTRSASDTTALFFDQSGSTDNWLAASRANVVTVTAGSNTFTAKYKVGGGSATATFADRSIIVIDLGS